MQNPRESLGDSKKNRQTQKMSNIPRHDRNNTTVSHGERSVRPNQRNDIQTLGNPLDVWVTSAALFRQLPTDEVIDEICRDPTNDFNTDDYSLNKSDQDAKNNKPERHWSEHLNDIVLNSQREQKRSNSNRHLMQLPKPPPKSDDISDFWNGRTPSFPIVDIQKENRSIMHSLLSAFVEINSDDEEVIDLDNNTEEEEDDDSLIQAVPPVPRIDYDDYLSLPFEQRLEIELDYAGFKKETPHQDNASLIFAQEIEQYKKKLKNSQPEIDSFKEEIKLVLHKSRPDEERRAMEQQKFLDIIPEFRKKLHKK